MAMLALVPESIWSIRCPMGCPMVMSASGTALNFSRTSFMNSSLLTSWKSQLRWSRLKLFHQFVKMIERHWDGIVSYCNPNNKVSLGLVEGINNKVRIIQ
ncbi:MAG: transposase [Candidatus Jettenia sp.]|nr:transposase [Candidatus Jettenia sp.]